ncbi:MAG: hypothetical protein QXQ76_04450 [Candidatus Bathyarchaeia archaeon]
MVHAGDTYILSEDHEHLRRLIEASEELDADATILIKRLGGARGVMGSLRPRPWAGL